MTGVIWFVQVVHYPLFRHTGFGEFPGYEAAHARLTTRLVAPLMVCEAVTALLLLLRRPSGVPAGPLWLGAALIAVVWIATAFIHVPQHRRLAAAFDATVHRRLVASNWIRTVAWSSRSLLLLWITARMIRGW